MKYPAKLPALNIRRLFSLAPVFFSSPRLKAAIPGVRRGIACGLAMLLVLPLGDPELFAQQAPYSGQYSQQPEYGYGQQPAPQGAYTPGDAQQQPYGDSIPPEPVYGQQPDSGQYSNQYPNQYGQQPGYGEEYAPQPQAGIEQQPYQPGPYGQYPQQPQQAQGLSPDQLEQLVAPIALYPDNLVAQILAASTYPAQVADADHWRQVRGGASPDQIAYSVDEQPWDASVKALTAFPQVLTEMDQNIQWTAMLGNAYYNQPQDVFDAIQAMRQRAQAAGTLQNTQQEMVSDNQGGIAIYPENPQYIYVPVYNPWTVYGAPISPYPGFSLVGALGSVFGALPIRFGLGVAMAAFSNMSWGWLSWGLSWLASSILFHQSSYFSHSASVADWGLPHGGPRAYGHGGYRTSGASGRQADAYGNRAYAGGAQRYGDRGYGQQQRYTSAYHSPTVGYARTSPGSYNARGSYNQGNYYNRSQAMPSRTEAYGRSNYNSGYGSSFYGRQANGHNNSLQAYRGSSPGYPRNDFGQRSYKNAYSSRSFAGYSGKQSHFGGGKAPKNFGGGKGFGGGHGGHGGGGGHGGHGGGKHHFL